MTVAVMARPTPLPGCLGGLLTLGCFFGDATSGAGAGSSCGAGSVDGAGGGATSIIGVVFESVPGLAGGVVFGSIMPSIVA